MEKARFVSLKIILLALLLGPAPALAQDGGEGWRPYRSDRFGFSFLFPADVFEQRSETPDGRGVELHSSDGRSRLKVIAAPNSERLSLDAYRSVILRELSEGNALQYGPMGRSWFVLSGVRGDSIYYQKVLFACGGRFINAFALTYPKQWKRDFDPIVTTIEKNFRRTEGRDCDR